MSNPSNPRCPPSKTGSHNQASSCSGCKDSDNTRKKNNNRHTQKVIPPHCAKNRTNPPRGPDHPGKKKNKNNDLMTHRKTRG